MAPAQVAAVDSAGGAPAAERYAPARMWLDARQNCIGTACLFCLALRAIGCQQMERATQLPQTSEAAQGAAGDSDTPHASAASSSEESVDEQPPSSMESDPGDGYFLAGDGISCFALPIGYSRSKLSPNNEPRFWTWPSGTTVTSWNKPKPSDLTLEGLCDLQRGRAETATLRPGRCVVQGRAGKRRYWEQWTTLCGRLAAIRVEYDSDHSPDAADIISHIDAGCGHHIQHETACPDGCVGGSVRRRSAWDEP